jgi:GTPase
VVRLDDGYEYVVADVPGLIEGASEGKGLGHRFLRHVERARVLCVLVDLAPMALSPPAEQLDVLLGELAAYQPDLLERERLVVGSRTDLAGAGTDGGGDGDGDGRGPDEVPIDLPISAVTGQGIGEVRGRLADAVRRARAQLSEPVQFVVHRPGQQGFEVHREGAGWVVEGRDAERAVALSDLTRADALAEAHRRLRKLGIDRALGRAGAQPGETVRIGGLTFDYTEES